MDEDYEYKAGKIRLLELLESARETNAIIQNIAGDLANSRACMPDMQMRLSWFVTAHNATHREIEALQRQLQLLASWH